MVIKQNSHTTQIDLMVMCIITTNKYKNNKIHKAVKNLDEKLSLLILPTKPLTLRKFILTIYINVSIGGFGSKWSENPKLIPSL